jgi:hypothetical protein
VRSEDFPNKFCSADQSSSGGECSNANRRKTQHPFEEKLNQLKADVKALEEGAKRLSGGTHSREVPGRNLRSVAGDGDRQYLSGLKVGGKRILLLVDTSASMLAEDIVNAVRRQLFPPETRLRARKWRQAVKAVDWLAAQMPREAQYQIYVFSTRARPLLVGTDGAGSCLASVAVTRVAHSAGAGTTTEISPARIDGAMTKATSASFW